MANILLFDIDRTLFNTDVFFAACIQRYVQKFGITESEIQQIRSEYMSNLQKTTDFDPYAFVTHLSQKTKKPFQQLYDVMWLDAKLYRSAVYLDVVENLQRLKTNNILGIFSEGTLNYQQRKLDQSGLLPFFQADQIYIFHRKLDAESLSKIPKNAVIVEDKEDIVKFLHEQGLQVIWLNRVDQRTLPDVKTIRSLVELN